MTPMAGGGLSAARLGSLSPALSGSETSREASPMLTMMTMRIWIMDMERGWGTDTFRSGHGPLRCLCALPAAGPFQRLPTKNPGQVKRHVHPSYTRSSCSYLSKECLKCFTRAEHNYVIINNYIVTKEEQLRPACRPVPDVVSSAATTFTIT